MRLRKRLRRGYKAVSRAVRYWLAVQILRVLLATYPRLPLSWTERAGRALGGVAWWVRKRDRELALSNLELVFGDRADAERKRISKEAARLLLVNALQVVWMAGNPRKMHELVEVEGLEHIVKARSEGKGAILLSAHFGNFVLLTLRMGFEDFTFSTVVNMPSSEILSSFIRNRAQGMGLNIISRKPRWAAVKSMVRRLQANEVVCVLADEEARKGGVWVDFFGYTVPTPQGPAALALRSGAPVLPTFIYRLGGGRQRIVIDPPLVLPRQEGLSAAKESMEVMTKSIEAVIREHPEEWPWVSHRWRKRLQ